MASTQMDAHQYEEITPPMLLDTHQSGHPTLLETHQSGHPTLLDTHQSRHPTLLDTHQSGHPTLLDTHQSGHPTLLDTHQSRHPTLLDTHQSGHPTLLDTHQAGHPTPLDTHQSRHPTLLDTHQSWHPTLLDTHQSGHPTLLDTHQSQHPTLLDTHQSRHPTLLDTHQSGHPTLLDTHQSGHPTLLNTHQSGHPTLLDTHQSRHPTLLDTHQSRHPTLLDTHQSGHPTLLDTHQSGHPTLLDTHQARHPTLLDMHQSGHPTLLDTHQSRHPTLLDTHQSGHPTLLNTHQSGHPTLLDTHQSGHPTLLNTHQSGHPTLLDTHQSGHPTLLNTHQSGHPTLLDTHQSGHPTLLDTHQSGESSQMAAHQSRDITQMDAHQSMDRETWERRKQRLEALNQQQAPGQPEEFINHQLFLAAKEGDVDKFIKALHDHCAKERVTLDVVLQLSSPSRNTLLHAAAESDNIVRAIIDFFPEDSISATNSKGETPLLIAARAGKTKAVELLLPHGKPLNTDQTSNSALHEAVRNRRYEVIRLLVSKCPDLLYRQNKESKSPWCLAVETGDLEVLRCLLQVTNEGENQRRADHGSAFGMSPAHVAIMHKKMDMLKEMWEKKRWLFELRDAENGTPLHFAAYTDYLDGVKFLLEKFPTSAGEKDRTDGYLPVHVACMMDHVRIVEELLRRWPDPAEFISTLHQNILHVSARHGSMSTVKYILKNPKYGHLINARDSEMNTPLHLAALHWQPSVLLLLARDRRVDLKLVNEKNMTALDVVEQDMKGMDVPLRKRLTRIILVSAGTPRSGELAICKLTGRSKGKELEPPELTRLKEEASARMVVAALMAGMTFPAGFSFPEGYSGSAGIAVLLHKAMYDVFVICNSIALFSSIIALVILLWAQIGDPHAVRNALLKARLPLLVALAAVPLAYMARVYVTVNKLTWLAIFVLVLGSVALFIILSCYLMLYIPLKSNNSFVRGFTDLIIAAGISMSGSVTAGSETAGRAATSSGAAPANNYRLHLNR